MSPTKVTHIVEQNRHGLSPLEIAQSIRVHHTTVTHILKWFKQSGNYYHQNTNTGHPRKMDEHERQIICQGQSHKCCRGAKKGILQSLRQDGTEVFERTGVIVSHLEVQALPNRGQ